MRLARPPYLSDKVDRSDVDMFAEEYLAFCVGSLSVWLFSVGIRNTIEEVRHTMAKVT